MVLANAYWMGNQTIVQRTLGARSEADAKASYVFGSLLKAFIPFLMVVPGIIALAHNPNIVNPDTASSMLVRDIMPVGFVGLFFAAFLAGLMSSVGLRIEFRIYHLDERYLPAFLQTRR